MSKKASEKKTNKSDSKNRKPTKARRSKKNQKSKKKNIMITFVAIIFISGFILDHFNQTYIYSNTIAKNIFIEGVDVSQMTKKKAIESVKESNEAKDINLFYNSQKYSISAKDINLKYSVEEAVNTAFNYTKTESYFENVKRYFNLKKNKKNLEIKPSYDEVLLSQAIEKVSNNINVDMVNAKVSISHGGSISTTSSQTGRELDIASTKESIYDMIESKTRKDIELKVNIKEPYITTDAAQSVNSLLAQYTTKFSNSSNRVTNINVAAKKSSDLVLMPGEEFSYNNLTGMRTKSNGYKDAPVIVNGELQEGVGGGVCQVSTTLYNSVLSSGLSVTSVRNHSLLSSYAPIGQDAMVNDSGTDFRFKNPFNHPIYIKTTVGSSSVTSKIYGNEADKKNISIKVDTYKENGLDAAKTYRVYKDSSGNIIQTEYVAKSVYKKPKK
ncbi:MAG: VanW family protein [Romboutsia sp.]